MPAIQVTFITDQATHLDSDWKRGKTYVRSRFHYRCISETVLIERIRVVKYFSQKKSAQALLNRSQATLLKKGLSLLFELAVSYPNHRQEVINLMTEFLRQRFKQDLPFPADQKDVLEAGIRALTSMPRLDENGFPLNFDVHQIRIADMDLTRTNFRYFSLWGCQFHRVILSHSSFEETDLGGAILEDCSLEYADLRSAKLCGSFMDKGRPARFLRTRLWGANLQDAEIEFCELHNFDHLDLSSLQASIDKGKLKVLSAAA